MAEKFEIERLGNQGDGVAIGGNAYIPFTLPGETVEAAGDGPRKQLTAILEWSPHRMEPFCQHFGTCGGCQLQHFDHDAYLLWKTGLLTEALAREEIEAEIRPILHFKPANRRRAVMTAKRVEGRAQLGFSGKASHELVAIENCPVLVEPLQQALAEVSKLASLIMPKRGDVRINLVACDNGLDLAMDCITPDQRGIRELIVHPAARRFIRISLNQEPVVEVERPVLRTGIANVTPPAGAFVQASAMCEQAMADLVVAHLGGCKKVADLFCGFGPFALRLAAGSMVHGMESDVAALLAMDKAWRETGGRLKALTHEKRDLFRRPMSAVEMKGFDGVVVDPPRAGAEAQMRELAKSAVKKVAAVSCNPQTLARDLKILVEGGFRILSATPIDQFAYTSHLEAVALLER
jgi:23S rRNA (uracil1939-C5)-methyltransferase